jgi:hypothetical protein
MPWFQCINARCRRKFQSRGSVGDAARDSSGRDGESICLDCGSRATEIPDPLPERRPPPLRLVVVEPAASEGTPPEARSSPRGKPGCVLLFLVVAVATTLRCLLA